MREDQKAELLRQLDAMLRVSESAVRIEILNLISKGGGHPDTIGLVRESVDACKQSVIEYVAEMIREFKAEKK